MFLKNKRLELMRHMLDRTGNSITFDELMSTKGGTIRISRGDLEAMAIGAAEYFAEHHGTARHEPGLKIEVAGDIHIHLAGEEER